MEFLKQATYKAYVLAKLSKNFSNQHTDFLKFYFTENSSEIRKGLEHRFQATFFIGFFDKKLSFLILYKPTKFHYQPDCVYFLS